MAPLASIIVNNYNYSAFLRNAIDSALNQTYPNIEVIVVDDGSTDNSRDIIKSYGESIVYFFKENEGQGSAYNAGFLKSKGEFVCNLDSDDTLFNNSVEKFISAFDEDIIKVQWPLLVVDAEGISTNEITTKWVPPEGDLKEKVLTEGPFYDFNLHVGCAYRRTFLEAVLPMPEPEYINGGDVYLTTLAPVFGHIRNVPEPLGTYRVHSKNNYAGRELDDSRIKNYIQRFETNCYALEKYAQILGFKTDIELWKRTNFNYLWPNRLLQAKNDIAQFIPEGTSYILINDNEWGEGEPVEGRNAIPLLEENGNYNVMPNDDPEAISELQKRIELGAGYIVFWWTSFWWFDHYKIFNNYIRTSFPCISENERLIIFDISNYKVN